MHPIMAPVASPPASGPYNLRASGLTSPASPVSFPPSMHPSNLPSPSHGPGLHQPPSSSGTPSTLSNAASIIDIDAVIQMATSARAGSRSPTGRDTRTQLFVGNLPYRVRWQDLKDLFRKAGTVLRADVSLGPDNRSRGYGTVLLATAEDAGRAIDMFNGFSWQTRTLEVRPDRLPPDFTDPTLSIPSAGGTPGSVQHFNRIHHPKPHIPHGSVPFQPSPFLPSPLPPQGIIFPPDMEVRVGGVDYVVGSTPSFSRKGSTAGMSSTESVSGQGVGLNSPGKNLFVGNLPFHCQWQDLKDLFRAAGQIIRADVAIGPDGRSRGYGTVLFATEADAMNAVAMFNGYEYNGRRLKVHHDKFKQVQGSGPTSPQHLPSIPGQLPATLTPLSPYPKSPVPKSPSINQPHQYHHQPPTQIALPMQQHFHYTYGAFGSQPGSPYDQFPPHINSAQFSPQPQHQPLSQPLSHMRPPNSPRQSQSSANEGSGGSGGGMPRSPPGTIQLPPSHLFTSGAPLSPLMTRGLPPMTPSMPGFTFHPQMATPPLAPHFLSPGLGPFSPGPPLTSPTYYHPFLNHAPGAPIHVQPGTPIFALPPHSPYGQPPYRPPQVPGVEHGGQDNNGYFPPVYPSAAEPTEYFPPVETLTSGNDESKKSKASREKETLGLQVTPPSDQDRDRDRVSSGRTSSGGGSLKGISDVMENLSLSMGTERFLRATTATVDLGDPHRDIQRAKSTTPSGSPSVSGSTTGNSHHSGSGVSTGTGTSGNTSASSARETPVYPSIAALAPPEDTAGGCGGRRASWNDVDGARRATIGRGISSPAPSSGSRK